MDNKINHRLYIEKRRVYSATSIIGYSYLTDGDNTSVYCLTTLGDLYVISGQDLEKCSGQNAPNQNIFADLLEGGDADSDIKMQFTSEPVYVLQSKEPLVKVSEKPVSMCVSPHHVAVVTEVNHGLRILLYKMASQDSTCLKEVDTEARQKMIVLPNMAATAEIYMKFVSADLFLNDSKVTSSDMLVLNMLLFKQLFGEDIALLESPVVLFCTHEGTVYFMPTSYFQNIDNDAIQCHRRRQESSRYRQLCQMSSNVSCIFLLTPSTPNSQHSVGSRIEESSPCLGICSYDGTVMFFSGDRFGNVPCTYRITLTPSVKAMCSYHDKIYHSNGEHLYETTVVNEITSDYKNQAQIKIGKTTVFEGPGVMDLHVKTSEGFIDAQGSPCVLQCFLDNGEVKQISPSNHTSVHHGNKTETVQTVLQSIDKVTGQLKDVALKKEYQTTWLRQLNIAAYLLNNYLRGECLVEDLGNIERLQDKSIHCDISTESNPDDSGSVVCSVISCDISHTLPHSLCSKWSLKVSIVPQCKSVYVKTVTPAVVTKSVNLVTDWKQSEKIHVRLVIDEETILQGCKLVVKLVLNFGDVIPIQDQEPCLGIPVYEERVDVLHFLVPDVDAKYRSNDFMGRVDNLNGVLNSHVVNRQHLMKMLGKQSEIALGKEISVKKTVVLGEDIHLPELGDVLRYLLPRCTMRCLREDHMQSQSHVFTVFNKPVYLDITENGRAQTKGKTTALEVSVRSVESIAAAVLLAISRKLMVKTQHLPVSLTEIKRNLRNVQGLVVKLQEIDGMKQATPAVLTAYETLRTIQHF